MMRILYTLLFLVLILPAVSYAQTNDKYEVVKEFDPSRDPANDLKEAVIEAQNTNKRIILDVGGNWCIWCHRLDNFIESNEEVKTYLNKNFITLKINFSKENKNEEFLSKYPEIPGYPHLFVLDTNGKMLHSQDTAELEENKGYSKNKMMTFLQKWALNKDK